MINKRAYQIRTEENYKCPVCENVELTFYPYGGQAECANCGNYEQLPPYGVALFEGRHTMPVDSYIFGPNETNEYGFHQELYNEAFTRGVEFTKSIECPFTFYPTGLTQAAIGFIDGCRSVGCNPALMNFDRETSEYVQVRTKHLFPETF